MKGAPRIDPVDVLIVRGAESTDDLQCMGLPMAERFQQAENVILIGADSARVVKGESATVSFIDADSRLDAVGRMLEKIYHAYQEAHHADAHLAAAFVAKFLFYCVIDDGRPMPVRLLEVIREGDIKAFELAADEYIDSDFSEHLLCSGAKFPDDGGTSEAYVAPTAVHGADG